ncbi:MAG: bifunctional tRNA (5-methylaminomethyl-2-thiouridine)(34)-methyltransferase MnmD/FAD-dependent 5-carboxymethylaminomethyl-2-thiouridine(34) oxidoreductase MnmC [Wenzhouxiangella sp.]
MNAKFVRIRPAQIDWQDDTPHSPRFQDSYFMPGRGAEESQVIFVDGNRLPQRFAALQPSEVFGIGETGFGSGLNLILAARCFLDHAPRNARLDLYSAELHPLTENDLQRAWPRPDALTQALLDHYPPPAAGHHLIELHPRIRLVLMLGDAADCWRQCRAQIDAWFLDGFAPARNPAMWSAELFTALAARSRPGASFATFTAAGPVRRGLSEAGFAVERIAGFGGKRHRLIGHWPGNHQPRLIRTGKALIGGAGLAGATTARALAERGWQVTVCDPAGIASGASGNLAGVVYATASAHMTTQNRFYQLALLYALRRLHRLGFPASTDDGQLNGVIQHAADERMARKLDQALAAETWPTELLEPVASAAVLLHGAGYLRPVRWCQSLLDHPAIDFRPATLRAFRAADALRIELEQDGQREVQTADALFLCMAEGSRALPGLDWLPLKLIRGQVSYVRATQASLNWQQAICHAGYLTPALDGLHCVGATYDLKRTSAEIDPADDQTNLDQLREQLPEHWHALGGEHMQIADRRAAVRCQTPDFLPLAGPLADPSELPHRIVPDVYLNLAHGSRGITHTPLCADLVADLASDLNPVADAELIEALAPERFILRRRRREPDWKPEQSVTGLA